MRDDLERALRGAQEPRPLPATLRARLGSALTARAWVGEPTGAAAIVGAMELESLLHDLGAPRPIPPQARERLARRLTARRVRAMRALSVAAALTLLAAGIALLRPTAGPDLAEPVVPAPGELPGAIPPQPPPPGFPPPPGTDTVLDGIASPGAGAGAGGVYDPGPPPPYMDGVVRAPAYGLSPPGSDPTPQPAAPDLDPLLVAVVRGDAEAARGFRRYLDVLNRAGGVRYQRIEVVDASPGRPAPDGVIATVNLSAATITGGGRPAWTRGPVLESFAAHEDVLHDAVFGFASPPERQAHLIADRFYPTRVAEPVTAAIYTGDGAPFADLVPDALEQVLRARGVTPVRVAYDPARPPVLVPADAAFLSLSTEAARAWFAASDGYRPARGIGGIYTLMEPSLLEAMDGRAVRIISPYARPDTPETTAHAFTGGRADHTLARAHGWVTAKNLAVAIWRDGAEDLARSLRRLAGYGGGFTPAYEVRPGTNARTPEGMLFAVRDARFEQTSGFLTDPF